MSDHEDKKYINPEELKEKIRELHAEPGTDELLGMPTPFHTITAKIVEEQDEMIRKAIHHIAGNVYEEITVDKNKVFDALSKATAKKPNNTVRAFGESVVLTCPVCEKWLGIEGIDMASPMYNYCPKCGQKIDWTDISKEATDDE